MIHNSEKLKALIISSVLLLGTFVMAAPGGDGESLPVWPEESDWVNYTVGGERVTDWEDKPYENDPTHGIANVEPAEVDIASGVDASGGGADNNPGNYTSVQYYYNDTEEDSDGCSNLDDDWLFLRMRLADDPRHSGKYAYKSYHWDILFEVDGDLWSEFVVDLRGSGGTYKFGTVGVYYNNNDDYEYDPDDDVVWSREASKASNDYTRPVLIDYGNEDEDDDQWWIEYKIPVTAFKNYSGGQLLCADTEFLMFFSTSASMTNPLQKDWMAEYVFGQPANITVVKTVLEDVVTPGDTIHYRIYYNNTGDFNASNVWINDTIPEYTTFDESSPDYDSVDGRTYRWHFTDVAPGNHTLYLNVTVDLGVPDETILENVVALNYTDHDDNDKPGSDDETENPVQKPVMILEKEADVATVDPGDIIEYTITYNNTGSGGAYYVYINDTIPSNTTFLNSTPDYESFSGDTYRWIIYYVPGNNYTDVVRINVSVDAYTQDETLLVNHVTLDYLDENDNPYDRLEAWANVTVHAPLMIMNKTADRTEANPGDNITYTISYENTATGNATDVVVVDTIDPDTSYVDATPGPSSVVGDVITWNLGTVEGGATGSITLTVEVDAYVDDEEIFTNNVTLNYDDANGNPYDELFDSVNVTCTAPNMTISKTVDRTEANPGDNITYTITYENTGTGNATGVVIVDTIDPDTTFQEATPAPDDIDGDVLTWNIGTVEGGTSGTITIIVKVDAYVGDGEVLTNNVTLNYNDTNDNPYDEEDDYVNVTVTAPMMTITKTVDKPEANPGDNITYTLTYENTGTGNATGVVIVDTIDPDTTFQEATPAPDDISGDVLTWYIDVVEGGTSGTITVIVKVDAYVGDGEVLTNNVTLNYNDTNDNPYDEEDDHVNVTVTAPMMTITKIADKPEANPGDNITYTITYENTGTGNATGVVIVDTIDPDTTFQEATPAPDDISGDVLTWNIGTVEGGASDSIEVIVKVDAYVGDGEVLTNNVNLNYNDTNGNPYDEEDDFVNVTVTAPMMTITKIADKPEANPGDNITYTITYENTGTGNATGVVIEDTIDPDTTFQEATPAPDSIVGDVLTWNIGTVEGGTSDSITLIVKVDAYVGDGEVLTNNVNLNYNDTNGNPYDEEDDHVNVTVMAPMMTITKTVDKPEANPSDNITYTINYENTGTGNATGVVIEDTIDHNTTYVDATPAPDSIVGDVLTWNIGVVAGGASGSIELIVEVDAYVADGEVMTNNVTLNYNDTNDNPYDEESDHVNVTCTAPIMDLLKTALEREANPGDNITYTISYENLGTGNATNVVIEDTIDHNTTYVNATPAPDSIVGDVLTWNIGTVVGGGFGSITLIVEVDAYVIDGEVMRNNVTLNYDDANGNPYDEIEDHVDVICTAPVMEISKTADTTTADPSDTIVYTIVYNNTGTGDAANVVVVDTIPADTTYVNATPAPDSIVGDVLTWNIGTVDGETGGTIEIIVTVDVGVGDGVVLRNNVTLNYEDVNGNPQDEEEDYAEVTVTAPIMSFSKSADVTVADPSDIIIYTLYYQNLGSGNATLVVVEDTIPQYVTFINSTPGYDSVSGRTYTWIIGTVSAYSNGTIIVRVSVNVSVDDGTLLNNTATLDYADDNGNYYDQLSDFANVTVTAPVMSFSKSANVITADPGDTIIYTLYYENSGSGDATLVVVVDTIPANVTYGGSNPTHDGVSGRTYTWNIGNVSAYSNGTITITVTVNSSVDDGTVLYNTATMDYADDNGNYYDPLDDYANVTVTAPIMSFSKSADVTHADPGDTIIYTLYYENLGSGIATLVVVEDTIPVGVTFVNSTPGYDSVSGRTYTWNIGNVSAYSSGYINITVTVNVSLDDGTVLHNTATLDYADDNGNYYDQLSDYANVTVTAPVMSFSKSADVTHADPGDMIIYTLYYENSGSGNATLVVVTDTIPQFVTYLNSTPGHDSVSGRTYTWNIGGVPAYSNGTIIVRVTVNISTDDGTVLHNAATMDYADANGNYYDQLSDYANVTVTAPVMSFSKSADVTNADPGDMIIYTLYYENSGSGNATLVVIEDTIPSLVTFVNSTPGYDSVSGRTYTWNIGGVPAYSNGTIIIRVTVNVSVDDGTVLHNTATMDYADANGNYYDQLSDYANVTVTAPVMSFSKTADVPEADPGDQIIYTLYYENSGSGIATLVVIEDTIPPGVTYVNSTPTYDSVSGRTYTWIIGNVSAYSNGTITLIVEVNISTEDGTVLHNTATMDYADANGNYYDPLDDFANVTVTAPILNITKTANVTNADPGDQINYTITFENNGSGNATEVWINDTIPADTTFISSTPGYNSSSGDTYTWYFALIESGESVTIYIVVEVDLRTPDEEVLHNYVTLEYSDDNGNPQDPESAFADVNVTAPELHIIKTVDESKADPGDTLVYKIEYWNSGTGWATLVEIVDTIPGDTTHVSSSPGHNSSVGDVYTWTIGSVGPGANGTIWITVTVDVGTPDKTPLHNVATLDYADANGNYYDQLDDYADTDVTAPVLHIIKTVDESKANPGDSLVYKIEYWNSGTGWATLVEIVDTIPSDTTHVSSSPAHNISVGDVYTWTIGSVGPGANGTIWITVTVDVGTPDKTPLHNVATLDYADANGNYYTQLSDYADTDVTAPVLHIIKTVDESKANPGDTLVYKIEYWNSGTGWATLVEIVDTIPGATTHVSSSPGHNSSVGDVYTWTIGNVGPGANGTIWITVTVDVSTPDKTPLHNVATLDYADANGNYYPQLDDYADTDVTAPVLHIVKTVDESEADPGDTLIYKIEYWNSGTGWATLVEIVDTIPGATTHVSSNPGHNSSVSDVYTWIIGSVGPGANGTIWITVTVDVGTPDETPLHNVATLDYADTNGNYYPQLDDYADSKVTAPILHILKTANVTYADPGDTIVYTIEYWNSGTGWASLVEIVDTIPADTTFVDSNPPYNSTSGDEYTWIIGSVAPGANGTITITVTVDPGTSDTTKLHNVATLDYADANGNNYPQLDHYADVTVTAPKMTIKKEANMNFADPGTTITYKITYTNTGTGYAYNVVIEDTIPADTTFVNSNPNATSSSGDTYTWVIGIVPPGTTHYIFINVTVDVGTPDTRLLHNEATLNYSDPHDNYYPEQGDYADVRVTAPDMSITKTVNEPEADPDDIIIYTLTYENTGSGNATLVVVVDTIPQHVTFVNSTPPPDSVSGRIYTWNIGSVLGHSNGTITIRVRVNVSAEGGTMLYNYATLDYADANGNSYPQEYDFAYVIVTAPTLNIIKTAGSPEADPGDTIIYTIYYWNSGNGWASLVKIVDTIDPDTTFVDSTPPYNSSSGDTYTWIIGSVAPGGDGTITITVTVDVGLSDRTPLRNDVALEYADANGNYYPKLSTYADVTVTTPIITITKTANVTEADPGDEYTYTLYYENTGSGNASGVIVVDTLPAYVSFVSATPSPNSTIGNKLIWLIANIPAYSDGSIIVTVTVNAGTPDRTVLHNVVTLNYSDANDNFIDQVGDYANVTVTAPVMTLDKEAGEIEIIAAYVKADIRLRITGEKWHNVQLYLYNGTEEVAFAEITRYPGDPDDQSVIIYNVTIDALSDLFNARVVYTPEDDPVNGQWWGANPCWLILTFEDGSEKRLKHTFNVRHEHTWIWIIDDFRPYLKGAPITIVSLIPYTITYYNIGTGDASNVIIIDTFPLGTAFLNSTPPYDSFIGNVYTWQIGTVLAGGSGKIFVNITFTSSDGECDVTNEVSLDYSDANGNFIERIYTSDKSKIELPEIDFAPIEPFIDYGILTRSYSGVTTTSVIPVNPSSIQEHETIPPEDRARTFNFDASYYLEISLSSVRTMHDETARTTSVTTQVNDEIIQTITEESQPDQSVVEEETETMDVVEPEATQDTEKSVPQESPIQPVTTDDSIDTTGMPISHSAGIPIISTYSLLAAILFALIALAAAIFIYSRPQIRKRS